MRILRVSILCVFVYLIGFFISLYFAGGGIKTTDKTTCDGVVFTERSYIEFKNVLLERVFRRSTKENVWVRPSKPDENMIIVKIDTELSGPEKIITVVPTFLSRIFSSTISYDAKKVIIWVPDEENKIICEKWIKGIEKQYFMMRKKLPLWAAFFKSSPLDTLVFSSLQIALLHSGASCGASSYNIS